MSLAWFFSSHLTSYESVELWITRSSLLISFCIIGPTVILILLDLLLWCFRAGQGPSADLIRRSRSGIDLLSRKSRSNSWSSSGSAAVSAASSILGMSPVVDKSPSLHASEERDQRTGEKTATFKREDTHPQGGVSNDDASAIRSLPQATTNLDHKDASGKQGKDTAKAQETASTTTLQATETRNGQSSFVEPPRGDLLHTFNLGKVIE